MAHKRNRRLAQGRRSILNPADGRAVDSRSLFHRSMESKWELLQALRDGTDAMRFQRTLFLPKNIDERRKEYNDRIARTFLFPGYDTAINRIVARPFSRPVQLSVELETLPEKLRWLFKDADGENKSMSTFASEVFDIANQFGMAHVLVDFPSQAPDVSLATEQSEQTHATLIAVRPDHLFGARAVSRDGNQVLTEIRLFETAVVDFEEFGEKDVERIRIYREKNWELWQRDALSTNMSGAGGWQLVDSGKHTFGAVPFVTYYIRQTGFMEARPTHEHLADLNLAHWQSSSDQRNILHTVRVPVLFAAGFTQEQIDEGFSIGASRVLGSKDPNATLRYVEMDGTAMKAGQEDLDSLEDKMRTLGMQVFLPTNSQDVVATGIAVNEAQSQSEIQQWIRRLEDFLLVVFNMAGKWTNDEMPEGSEFRIFNNFSIGILAGSSEAAVLLNMRTAGEIDQATYLKETQRRGLISEDADVDKIIERTKEEKATGDDVLSPSGVETPNPHEHTEENPLGITDNPHTHTADDPCGINEDGTPQIPPHMHTAEFPQGELCA